MRTVCNLTKITNDLPGIGGCIKQHPEDFFVEEQPLYTPDGLGEHLYLYIEKRLRTTIEVIRRLAKVFHISRGDIGYAGLKDKHAVTRQMFSIRLPDPTGDQEYLEKLQYVPSIKLLWSARHTNKLRRGHHAGNRFIIKIRDVDPGQIKSARAILNRLIHSGVPNYVGHQRFGYRLNSHILGLHLIKGQYQQMLDELLGHPQEVDSPELKAGREAYDNGDPVTALEHWPRQLRFDRQALDALRQGKNAKDAVLSTDRMQRSFLICALQSAMFNIILDQRVREGLFDRLIPGDLAWIHASRAVFAVDEPTAELENAPGGRMPELIISPSGPMWGQKMTKAAGRIGEMELAALEEYSLNEQDMYRNVDGVDIEGSRRPMRIILQDPNITSGCDEYGEYIQLSFILQRGAFATTVLTEIMKNDLLTSTRKNQDHNIHLKDRTSLTQHDDD